MNSRKQAWKFWWHFLVACCQSHTFTCQTGMCIVSYFVRVFKPMWKKTLLNFGSVLCASCPTVFNFVTNFLSCHLHRHTQEQKNEYKENGCDRVKQNPLRCHAMPSKVCAPWHISIVKQYTQRKYQYAQCQNPEALSSHWSFSCSSFCVL
jgi:hypothetical protein